MLACYALHIRANVLHTSQSALQQFVLSNTCVLGLKNGVRELCTLSRCLCSAVCRLQPNTRAGLHGQALDEDAHEESLVQRALQLPDHVMLALLKREHLRTCAELHILAYDHDVFVHGLKMAHAQLRKVFTRHENLVLKGWPLGVCVAFLVCKIVNSA